MNNQERLSIIKSRLTATLKPETIQVTDDSHLHVGHPGAKDGRGHFSLEITAKIFEGKTLLQRHRMIYQALGNLMETDIHALHIRAQS